MSLLVDIEEYLTDQLTAAVLGDVTHNELPPTPDEIVVFSSGSGSAPDTGLGVDGLQYEHPGLLVRVRGAARDVETPRVLITSIFQQLAKLQAVTVNSTLYLLARAQQSPYILNRDGNERVVWAVNYLIDLETP